MAVSIRCTCGKLLDTDEQHRGQSVQCPNCQAVVLVPAAMATQNPVNDKEAVQSRKAAEQGEIILGVILIAIGSVMYYGFDLKFGGLIGLAGVVVVLRGSKAM